MSVDAMMRAVLILHFVGLALGTSASIAVGVMMGVMGKAAPAERPVLARFMPAMSRVGRAGLALLWVTGLSMLFLRYGSPGQLPWTFHVKLLAVSLLTAVAVYLRMLEKRAMSGDATAAPRMQRVAKVGPWLALTAVIFAVLTFD
jgi:hypothetical protein